MRRGLATAPEIYRPGEFWDGLNATNLEMLRTEGVANFKRTVSHNYYDWLVTSVNDPQFRYALLNWLKQPTLAPLTTHLDEPATGHRNPDREHAYTFSRYASWCYRLF